MAETRAQPEQQAAARPADAPLARGKADEPAPPKPRKTDGVYPGEPLS